MGLGLVTGYAQDPRLAQQYLKNGEYEKAESMYQSLYQKNPQIEVYFSNYLECLISLRKTDDAESLIKKEIDRRPKDCMLYAQYGAFLEKTNQAEKSEKQYEKALQNLSTDLVTVYQLSNFFINQNKFEFAISTIEKAQKTSGTHGDFQTLLADLYRKKGDYKKMLENYLLGLKSGVISADNLQNLLVVYLPKDLYPELQAHLYAELEKNPELISYMELLAWSFIQNKDYVQALRQYKAIDAQLQENGNRVYNLSHVAMQDGDYKTAIDGFTYLKNKGNGETFYLDAVRQTLICKRKLVVEKNNYNQGDLVSLESEYEQFRKDYGTSRMAAQLIIEYAELEARYLRNVEKAISILEELIKQAAVDPQTKAEAKLDLADYYLITGERWEATLLYSQVDKDFLEDQLGESARFRNARLSYFAGDFAWAQEQFDILKQATSKLISNDAIDLSVFILDNLAKDTLGEALQLYASAELKVFQNQYDEALNILDSIQYVNVENTLEDDVWYLQGRIFDKQQKTKEALAKYEKILEKYKDDIRADNALWEMAKIYDYQLEDKAKAKELYEKLFIDFSGSILAVEARKRFRTLRGDPVQ